jgi:integrase
MTAELHEELEALRVGRPRVPRGTDPVFTLRSGRALRVHHLRRRFKNAVAATAAKDEKTDKPLIPDDKREQLRFHDIRHTAASLMVAAAVPIFDVSKILGHSTVEVTMRYAHFAPEAGRAAIDALGRALKAV